MYLFATATIFEMEPFLAANQPDEVETLITGVGPVETAFRLTSYLKESSGQIQSIVNFGVGGAYVSSEKGPMADLLDICLAESEVFGDLGVCLGNTIERITTKGLEIQDSFVLDVKLRELASRAMTKNKIPYHSGNFVTVSCTTGTAARGAMLASQHDGLCENMEGAAVARVCQEFNLPCLEIRSISNLVEDRDLSTWKLKQACIRSAQAASVIVPFLVENSHV